MTGCTTALLFVTPSPVYGSISVSSVLKCCRTPRAPLLGCLGTDSARILTQICDITMKDEYLYIYIYNLGGGGGGVCTQRDTHKQRQRSICRDLILLKN